MGKKRRKQRKDHMTDQGGTAEAFNFGEPTPILASQLQDYVGVWLLDNGSYYSPPVSLAGLARLRGANAYHGPLLEFKTNMIMRAFKGSAAVPMLQMLPFVTDYVTFLNAYFQKVTNWMGEVIALVHLPAINMRRMKEPGQYCMLNVNGSRTDFQPGEVIHVKNYDVAQTIYGLPSYLGAIQSMLLNEDATLFRRRYYLNGAHAGYIFYSSAATLGDKEQNAIRDAVKSTKKLGNFRNLYLHVPNGREKDFQIIPVGDFSTKDDLEKIKNISRDDIIAAHRIPPALASVVPTEARGGFGDITKADQVYEKNEIEPIRKILLQINDHLTGTRRIAFDEPEYAP
ncbi:phage portal protein [Desulfoluna butyratoxydans]|uniref:Bacteriophage/gene transfer agent portal protein n=1 Tax=Desulfoluna butyratoxydans TaxID=231438 RepID=A0A4U8YTS7_9BACT|nr:phage portal protein [Desulfoluna butyratoxydans]VFQ47390.1 bacteriophage/gene transfer agent portal protein [Desulfoluna butyratoxydans]